MATILKGMLLGFVLCGWTTAQMTGEICYSVTGETITVNLASVPSCEGTITVIAEVVGSGVPVDITPWFTGNDITPPDMKGEGAFNGGPWFCDLKVEITVICTTGAGSTQTTTEATINCNC